MDADLPGAMAARRALREDAGLEEEGFPLPALIGMLSDEIEASRKAGRSDEQIAGLVSGAARIDVTADDVHRYYAEPEARRRG